MKDVSGNILKICVNWRLRLSSKLLVISLRFESPLPNSYAQLREPGQLFAKNGRGLGPAAPLARW